MKKWLKFIGLSFFSDKISKEAVKRGYLNFVLGMIFALVFLFLGTLAADLLPFSTHYNNSADFSAFVRNAVTSESLSLEIKSGKLTSARNADSFINEADSAEFDLGGYRLAVDTRPADAFDDFEAYYLSNDGTNQKISMEEYATLSDVAKRNFEFKIRYTHDELVLTDELTAEHEDYLKSINSESFSELQKNKGELTREEYKRRVYNLYAKAYYPDFTAYESTGSAPLLRNYYYHAYADAEKFLFIFDDSCVGSFETNSGMRVEFYGFYKDFQDGATFKTEQDADAFIKSAFMATASLSVYVYIMNTMRLLPFIVLMPIIVALITFCVLRIMKSEFGKSFGGCVKVTGSYLLVGSLLAAIITLVCGFFVPRNSLMIAAILVFFIILLVRSAVLLVRERLALKKTEVEDDTLRR